MENPDGIAPASDSGKYIMFYKGTGIGSGVLFRGNGYKAASFGFPLEATDNLDQVLKATLNLF